MKKINIVSTIALIIGMYFALGAAHGWKSRYETIVEQFHNYRNAETKPLVQKEQVEIVAVYQVPNGAFETCLKHADGTRSLWTNHKLGESGEKINIWRSGSTEWLQDPN